MVHRYKQGSGTMTSERVLNVQKIAILRANGIGDFIFTLPALEALREAYPSAEIVLLGKAWHADFLKDRPSPIDRVIVIPSYGGVSVNPGEAEDVEEIERFFSSIVHEQFDIAIQMHGGGRYSNKFVKRLGAKMTVGMRTFDALPLDRWLPYIYFQHEVIRYHEVVKLIGAQPTQIEPHITVTKNDSAEALTIVPEDSQPLVTMHPGAGDPRRRWSPEKFATVGDALAATGAKVVVTGTGEESALTAAVVKHMRAPAIDLSNKLSLNGLTGLLVRSCIMISNDSGPLHIAYAVDTATVSIYWCSNLINCSPLTRMKNRPLTSWQLECPVCGVNCLQGSCKHQASFVDDIPVEDVTKTALELYHTIIK